MIKPLDELYPDCGRYARFVSDENDQIWQEFQIPKEVIETEHGLFGMPCQSLCKKTLDRFHLACAYCRLRRVYRNEIPTRIRVQIVGLAIWQDRSQNRVKDLLLKKLLTICQFLAS